ncbi:MAG: A/G-specific adenine glycosylase, partial [Methanoregulaceae archaeon]|nr:A/G-specific adenine glycosylase [Methanoregulaceae archaeon]
MKKGTEATGNPKDNREDLTPEEFRKRILHFYQGHRRDFPWRNTRDPYRILVSEIMLQQTQVKRVQDLYPGFISRFPDFSALDATPVEDLLRAWQGLGYNRRALALKNTASRIMKEWNGLLPDNEESLRSLPGVGKATAAAVQAFAFGKPSLLIETNIRRVFIHCYFRDRPVVSDGEILPLVAVTLDAENPRDWYYALMDYGSYLGKTRENPNRRSRQYKKQSPFRGSVRQVRGRILSFLVGRGCTPISDLYRELGLPAERGDPVLATLMNEGFIVRDGEFVKI